MAITLRSEKGSALTHGEMDANFSSLDAEKQTGTINAQDVGLVADTSGNYGWRDITADIIVRGTGPTNPALTQLGTSGIWAYKFTVGDEANVFFHVNHDYEPGDPIHLHAHWTSDGTNTGLVKWQFTYTVAKGHNQGNFNIASPSVDSAETAGAGTAWRHMISETTLTIDVTAAEPDSIIMVNIKRVTPSSGSNSDSIFLFTADCHYKARRFVTKNKVPNFYA